MRAPRPAPAPYTPKRALNNGSSAGAAAALGIQKLAGKNDLFAFSSAFLTGYLAGIPLGRFEAPRCFHFAYRACHGRTKLYGILVCLVQLVCRGIFAGIADLSLRFSFVGQHFYGGLFCVQGHCIRCVRFRHLCVRRGTCACCLLAPELPAGACAVGIHALACA